MGRLVLACLAFIVRAGFGLGAPGAGRVAERFAAGFLPFARLGVLGLRVFGRGGRAGVLPAVAALAGEDLSALFGVDLDDGGGSEPKSDPSQAAVAAPVATSTRKPKAKASAATAGKAPTQPPRPNTRRPNTPTRAKGKNPAAKRSATRPAPDAPNPKPARTIKAKQAITKRPKAAPRSKTSSKA